MAYLGNDLQVAFPVYRNIDDISGSFNSSTTSFPLRVSGVAPVPAPLYSQQCLISVGGVVQRPDDSGSEGFRLSGGNIIFASAPTTGADFFGIILAGADYINAGGNFPSGTAAVPSITFNDDLDTGIYNSGINQVSITTGGSERLRIDSAGQIESVSLGTAAAPAFSFTTDPNTGIYSPGADQVAISTGGSGRLFVDANGRVGVGTSSPSNLLNVEGSGTTAIAQVVNTSSFTGGTNFTNPHFTLRSGNDTTGNVTRLSLLVGTGGQTYIESLLENGATVAASTVFRNRGADGVAERMRITSTGRVGIGFAAPPERLSINDSNANAYVLVRSGIVNGDAAVKFNLNDVNYGGIGLENTALVMRCSNSSTPAERARIDSSGRLLVGTSSARSGVFFNGDALAPTIQLEGTTSSTCYSATRVSNGGGDAVFVFAKARGATVGSTTVVQNGDGLGTITFQGADGSEFVEAARISAAVDDTPGANDMPGRLVFSTTADGASSPTERMRIGSNGAISLSPSGTTRGVIVGNAFYDPVNAAGIQIANSTGTGRSLSAVNGSGALQDNYMNLGDPATRWGTVYAATGTINTSDANLKQNVEDLDTAELTVATAIKRLIKKFRFIDAVADKGDDARIHVGVIAQEVEQAFIDEGLDPRRYALFCEDTLEDGSKRLGIRYDELLAFVVAAL